MTSSRARGESQPNYPLLHIWGRVYNPLERFVRGLKNNMPAFIQQDWGEYKLRVVPSDNTRRLLRNILGRKYDILPYFYGAHINLTLSILMPKTKPFKQLIKTETISYEWRLCNRDETQIIKTGQGTMQFNNIFPFAKAKINDVVKDFNIRYLIYRKIQAIQLGLISITGQYKLIMSFTDSSGKQSGEMIMGEFTVKDRDDFYTSVIWPVIITTVAALIGGLIGWIIRGGG